LLRHQCVKEKERRDDFNSIHSKIVLIPEHISYLKQRLPSLIEQLESKQLDVKVASAFDSMILGNGLERLLES
jgi:hypothetical protein